MCTAMTIQTIHGDTFFGRTMDFSYLLDPELYIVPKGYRWNTMLNTHQFRNPYSFIGIGQDISPITFADGVNDMGFAAAALYFPGYAQYDAPDSDDSSKIPVAAVELLSLLLGSCASVEHAVSLLDTIRIIGVADSITHSVAPLHWLIADQNGRCVVIEKVAAGLRLYDDSIGVLSNSPDFPWHMANLRNYMNITASQQDEAHWNSVSLTPFGQGAGTFGLPGDYTPPSRFVRTAYHKSHAFTPTGDKEAVLSCFHIMESVSIPKGSVMTDRGAPDYTQYTAFMNLTSKKYFFRTYANSQITTASLDKNSRGGPEILSLGKLNRPAEFNCLHP
ncbi:choloylglycine hydrolase family protein [Lacrimispora sp. NSJ-141]|uniref:Choloylglycine hydrolase family protein n=1 Tax=Lientehia hominis TaxID=2897778 RepID=A0AAP2W9C8_9FIRM|nr:choloylglycine hydrolase family protein [Lientehia hominis]MCD2493121.1 choloylglycine hydrolase family protein [Lientehia hominis]